MLTNMNGRYANVGGGRLLFSLMGGSTTGRTVWEIRCQKNLEQQG